MKKETKEPIQTKYRLVAIQWRDAESDIEWTEQDKLAAWADEDCTIHEVGWVVSETKKYIVITNQLTYDGIVGNRTKIPRKWIKSMYFLNPLKKSSEQRR